MLTVEQNEELTRVGPGTPMGELLRRYWYPIAFEQDFEHLPPGAHSVFTLHAVNEINQTGRKFETDGFRLGILEGQRVKRAVGRLSSLVASQIGSTQSGGLQKR